MITSILTSTKKNLGVAEAYEEFDDDILMYINSAISTLTQLGVGPSVGFEIVDKTATWDDFIGTDPRLNNVKSYITLRARMLFDPPQTSYLISAMERQISEKEWRLNVVVDDELPIPDLSEL